MSRRFIPYRKKSKERELLELLAQNGLSPSEFRRALEVELERRKKREKGTEGA
jgi:hypothetical protein